MDGSIGRKMAIYIVSEMGQAHGRELKIFNLGKHPRSFCPPSFDATLKEEARIRRMVIFGLKDWWRVGFSRDGWYPDCWSHPHFSFSA